jgi:plasmid maintenance system antidote protein VapI
MSNLASYLEQNSIKQADFAETLGISRSFLSLIISGKRGLPLSLAFRIEEETNGAVTAKSFLNAQDGDAAPASQGQESHTASGPFTAAR